MKQLLPICGSKDFGFSSTGYFTHTQLKNNDTKFNTYNEKSDIYLDNKYTEFKEVNAKR